MRTTMHRFVAGALGAGIALTASAVASAGTTAPASDWDAVIAAAQEEGELTVYQPGDPRRHERLAEAFKELYGIEISIVGGAAGELQPRFDEERRERSGEVDVFLSANPAYMNEVIAAGDFAPIESPVLEHEVFTEYPQLLPDPSAVIVVADAPYIMWNTELVDEPVTSYQNLVERADEFEGSVAVAEPYAEFVVEYYTAVEAGVGEGWLEEMLDLDPQLFTSAVPLSQSVAAGENAVGIMVFTTVYTSVLDAGAPVDGIIDPNVQYSVNLVAGVTAWAGHPNAGQLYLDFLLSPEGQAIVADRSLSIYPDQPFAVGGPESIVISDEAVRTPENVEAFRERWDAARG